MKHTRDVVAEWPDLVDHPISGDPAALHVSDRDLDGGAWRAVSGDVLDGHRYYAVFLTTEADTPLCRAQSFWKHHPGLSALGETWERSGTSDNTITRVALLELNDLKDTWDALFSTAVPSRQRVLVVTGDAVDVDAYAGVLVGDPALSHAQFRPRGLMPWLLRAGLSFGALVVLPEDGADGSSGLGFYGDREQVNQLRNAVRALPTSRP